MNKTISTCKAQLFFINLLIIGLWGNYAFAADIENGIYKNGKFVDSLSVVTQSGSNAQNTELPGTKDSQTQRKPRTFIAPTQSARTLNRNATYFVATKKAKKIEHLLHKGKTDQRGLTTQKRKELAQLLREFLTAQNEARKKLLDVETRIQDLGLDTVILKRQQRTIDRFDKRLEKYIKDNNEAIKGNVSDINQALDDIEQNQFAQEPELLNTSPTFYDANKNGSTLESNRVITPSMVAPTNEIISTPFASAPPTAGDLAETIEIKFTPEIINKANELGNSPVAIYEFVRNEVEFQPYAGSRKSAANVLVQMRGNAVDQASLLMALLRASGIPSRYVRGQIEVDPDRVMSWLGVEDALTANDYLATSSIDAVATLNGPDVTSFLITHIWVEAYVPYSDYRGIPKDNIGNAWIPLDPSFKQRSVTLGQDVLTAMGFNADVFLSNYISTFTEPSPIEQLILDIQAHLDATSPGTTINDIKRVTEISTQQLGVLPSSLPYELLSISDRISELEDSQRYKIRFHLYDGPTDLIDHTINLSEIIGHGLTIEYIGATAIDEATIDSFGGIYETPPNLVNVKSVLKIDGIPVVTSINAIGMGFTHSSDLHFIEPAGTVNDQPTITNEIIAGNGQAIAFDSFLDISDAFLDPNAFPSDAFLESLLHNTAVDYLSRVDRGHETMEAIMKVKTFQDVSEAIVTNQINVVFNLGIPTTFEWTGLQVDADRRIIGKFDVNGDTASIRRPYHIVTGMDGSIMENRVFEDIYGPEAVSTIKILELANDASMPICTIETDIATDCPGFNHSIQITNEVNAAIAGGRVVTIPRDPMTISLWSGTGYIDMVPLTGGAAYVISGEVSGGATVESWIIPLSKTLTCNASETYSASINIIDPPADAPAIGAVFKPENKQIPLNYHVIQHCLDAGGTPTNSIISNNVFTETPKTTEQYGPGEYEIIIQHLGVSATRKLAISSLNIETDINNDGLIDHNDEETEENDLGEIIMVNKPFDPSSGEDDFQKVNIHFTPIMDSGIAWFTYDNTAVKIWSDANKTTLIPSASDAAPSWNFSSGDSIPTEVYVEGIAPTPEGNSFDIKYFWKVGGITFTDTIHTTVTDKIGHYAYFLGIRDQIIENKASIYLDEIVLPGGFSSGSDFNFIAVLAEKASMSVLDAKAKKWKSIDAVNIKLTSAAIIINGTFFTPPPPLGFTFTEGTVVNNSVELTNISKPVPTIKKPEYKGYFAQQENGEYIWERNKEVKNASVKSGVSGLAAFIPKNPGETYTDIINQINIPHESQYKSALAHVGIADNNGENILFLFFTSHPTAKDFDSNVDRSPLFDNLVKSGASMCYGLDGSSSVGVAHIDLDGNLDVVVRGAKHTYIPWRVNNYLVFHLSN